MEQCPERINTTKGKKKIMERNSEKKWRKILSDGRRVGEDQRKLKELLQSY